MQNQENTNKNYGIYMCINKPKVKVKVTQCVQLFATFWYSLPFCLTCGSAGKESACNVGDLGSIPVLGRSPGEGNGYPL